MDDDVKFDEQILSLIAKGVPGRFKKAKITRDMHLQRDLGLDSLALSAMVFRLEEVFDIDLGDVDLGINIAQLRTVGDAINASRQIVQQARNGGDL